MSAELQEVAVRQFEIGKKYYRIARAVWHPKDGEYEWESDDIEYESEESARTALSNIEIDADTVQCDLMEYEYNRYGLTRNERRLLIKDGSGTYDESGTYVD